MGKILNVPEGFLKRHPFPGPGLAVRVLGDVTEGNALDILRQVLTGFLCSSIFGSWSTFQFFYYYFLIVTENLLITQKRVESMSIFLR